MPSGNRKPTKATLRKGVRRLVVGVWPQVYNGSTSFEPPRTYILLQPGVILLEPQNTLPSKSKHWNTPVFYHKVYMLKNTDHPTIPFLFLNPKKISKIKIRIVQK